MKFLVTGGAGFIGSAFVRLVLGSGRASQLVNLDKLTYAGNLENLLPVAANENYRFVHGDICDAKLVNDLVAEFKPDAIVHFAAESHVDRSILSPAPVFETNLRGTFTMLEAAPADTNFKGVSFAPVPLPAGLPLLLAGLAVIGLAVVRRPPAAV